MIGILLIAKASLQPGGPFFGKSLSEDFALVFVFSLSALGDEIVENAFFGAIASIFVGGVYAIGSYSFDLSAKESVVQFNPLFEANAFMKGIKT